METAGLILLTLGIVLMVADAFLGLGFIADLAAPILVGVGAILVVHEHNYDPPGWLILLIVQAAILFVVTSALAFYRARRAVFGGDGDLIIGRIGVARTDLTPDGLVVIKGEQWAARSTRGIVRAGERVTVTGRDGTRLLVDDGDAAKPGASLPRQL